MSNNLGRLIKTLKEMCPECGEQHLQLRSRELDSNIEQEYNYCPLCNYERKLPYKDKGRKHGDKKRIRTETFDGKVGNRGVKGSFRRGH